MKKIRFYLLILAFMLLSGCSTDREYLSRPFGDTPAEIAVGSLPAKALDHEELIYPADGGSAALLADCNGDGTDELIVCTVSSSGSPEISLRIFAENKGDYEPFYTETVSGSVIDSLSVVPFGSGASILVFGWGASNTAPHEIKIFGFSRLYPEVIYSGFCDRAAVYDIDDDGEEDILLISAGNETECGTVTMLSYINGRMETVSSVPLSAGLGKIEAMTVGNIGFKLKALLCEGYIKGRGYVTDCIICSDGVLANIFYSSRTGVSEATLRPVCVWSRDIDGDGCIELPSPKTTGNTVSGWFIDWLRPSSEGTLNTICTSYSDFDSGWYLILPDNMGESLTAELTADHSDVKNTLFIFTDRATGARTSLWAVYEFIGENADTRREKIGFRPSVYSQDSVFCLKFYSTVGDFKYSETSLASNFHISEKYTIDPASGSIDK